ncbi:GAF domain-containing protein [Rufibacter tibetensis]|nr:GAF domain-containing protein [Rufibacter tibetensis]
MLGIWNPRLEVAWATEDETILDAAVRLSQRSEQPSFADDVLLFLHQHSGADVIMICHKTSVKGEMKILRLLYQGQSLPIQATYTLEGTPCANVTRHGVLYFPTGVQKRFPADVHLREYGIDSYFGSPLMGTSGDLLGVVALQHQKPLPNAQLIELLLTILSPSLETLLEDRL